MTLGLNDLHAIFDRGARTLKVWDVNHQCVLSCEARNRTTVDGQYGHDGNCPPGEFIFGMPIAMGSVPFGPYFIPILDYGANHAMKDHGRSGIGAHGGGSGLAQPFAPRQGWQVTHGCWRLQNEDLDALVKLLNAAHADGGVCYVTVDAPSPAVPLPPSSLDDDWAPLVELAPGE